MGIVNLQKYLISSPEFYGTNAVDFSSTLHKQLRKYLPGFALYRDKSNLDYALLAADFVEVCNEFENIKSFIHRDADLAKALNARGVHLTSTQFYAIEYAKTLELEVIVSTHTHEEVLRAQQLGADYVTYSPIFSSPGKGKPKGIEDLRELLSKCSIKVFALGGIVYEEQIAQIDKCETYGFASIRYFY